MVGSPLRFTCRSTEQCSGRPSRSGPGARNATFIASPIGRAWIAACVATGSGGSNTMASAANTPVDTVTMADRAVTMPLAVSTDTPALPHDTRVTGVAQPDIQPLAQPPRDERADAAVRHQIASRQHIAQPVAQAELVGAGDSR